MIARVHKTNGLLLALICLLLLAGCAPAPTPTPLPTPSPTVRATPTLTATATRTNTPAPTATPGIAWTRGAHLQATALQPVSATATVQDKQMVEFAHCDNAYDEPVTFHFADYAPITVTMAVSEMAVMCGTEVEVPIPAGLRVELLAAVRDAYTAVLEEIEAEMADDPFVIPVGQVITFVVLREERVYEGTLNFVVVGIEYEAAYTYTLSVPTRAGERSERCGG